VNSFTLQPLYFQGHSIQYEAVDGPSEDLDALEKRYHFHPYIESNHDNSDIQSAV
jgi:hypothetical protein